MEPIECPLECGILLPPDLEHEGMEQHLHDIHPETTRTPQPPHLQHQPEGIVFRSNNIDASSTAEAMTTGRHYATEWTTSVAGSSNALHPLPLHNRFSEALRTAPQPPYHDIGFVDPIEWLEQEASFHWFLQSIVPNLDICSNDNTQDAAAAARREQEKREIEQQQADLVAIEKWNMYRGEVNRKYNGTCEGFVLETGMLPSADAPASAGLEAFPLFRGDTLYVEAEDQAQGHSDDVFTTQPTPYGAFLETLDASINLAYTPPNLLVHNDFDTTRTTQAMPSVPLLDGDDWLAHVCNDRDDGRIHPKGDRSAGRARRRPARHSTEAGPSQPARKHDRSSSISKAHDGPGCAGDKRPRKRVCVARPASSNLKARMHLTQTEPVACPLECGVMLPADIQETEMALHMIAKHDSLTAWCATTKGCPLSDRCGKEYKVQEHEYWRTKVIARHLVHAHIGIVSFHCPAEGCSYESQRADGVTKHIKAKRCYVILSSWSPPQLMSFLQPRSGGTFSGREAANPYPSSSDVRRSVRFPTTVSHQYPFLTQVQNSNNESGLQQGFNHSEMYASNASLAGSRDEVAAQQWAASLRFVNERREVQEQEEYWRRIREPYGDPLAGYKNGNSVFAQGAGVEQPVFGAAPVNTFGLHSEYNPWQAVGEDYPQDVVDSTAHILPAVHQTAVQGPFDMADPGPVPWDQWLNADVLGGSPAPQTHGDPHNANNNTLLDHHIDNITITKLTSALAAFNEYGNNQGMQYYPREDLPTIPTTLNTYNVPQFNGMQYPALPPIPAAQDGTVLNTYSAPFTGMQQPAFTPIPAAVFPSIHNAYSTSFTGMQQPAFVHASPAGDTISTNTHGTPFTGMQHPAYPAFVPAPVVETHRTSEDRLVGTAQITPLPIVHKAAASGCPSTTVSAQLAVASAHAPPANEDASPPLQSTVPELVDDSSSEQNIPLKVASRSRADSKRQPAPSPPVRQRSRPSKQVSKAAQLLSPPPPAPPLRRSSRHKTLSFRGKYLLDDADNHAFNDSDDEYGPSGSAPVARPRRRPAPRNAEAGPSRPTRTRGRSSSTVKAHTRARSARTKIPSKYFEYVPVETPSLNYPPPRMELTQTEPVRCPIGCGVMLPASIQYAEMGGHLTDYHNSVVNKPGARQIKCPCRGCGTLCGKSIRDSFGTKDLSRHLVAQHLKITWWCCPADGCGFKRTREELTKYHISKVCYAGGVEDA
ncbi:hypothetical protein PHLGIDRAFT_122605 [Phlebiopsis gigantea 11061_1 CR5-6]|uniref:Uncharacterized protein n=1 Tax=Phlebiopsis gigantea (strain 11061_1 CR5-6) TaxID=745531 RepID=A0A0C3S070_PHLG1|nr:hypothetical protein PHLGIDRAFT_122605 [Phlebiopsis gigantea 11061_1 CR5-6]